MKKSNIVRYSCKLWVSKLLWYCSWHFVSFGIQACSLNDCFLPHFGIIFLLFATVFGHESLTETSGLAAVTSGCLTATSRCSTATCEHSRSIKIAKGKGESPTQVILDLTNHIGRECLHDTSLKAPTYRKKAEFSNILL